MRHEYGVRKGRRSRPKKKMKKKKQQKKNKQTKRKSTTNKQAKKQQKKKKKPTKKQKKKNKNKTKQNKKQQQQKKKRTTKIHNIMLHWPNQTCASVPKHVHLFINLQICLKNQAWGEKKDSCVYCDMPGKESPVFVLLYECILENVEKVYSRGFLERIGRITVNTPNSFFACFSNIFTCICWVPRVRFAFQHLLLPCKWHKNSFFCFVLHIPPVSRQKSTMTCGFHLKMLIRPEGDF